MHDLEVVEDPQAVLPCREPVGARRDRRVDLRGAIAKVQRGRVALVIGAPQPKSARVEVIVGADRARLVERRRRIDRRIEAAKHVRGRPDAGPAEDIVGRRTVRIGAGGKHPCAGGVRAGREVLDQRDQVRGRGSADRGVGVDEQRAGRATMPAPDSNARSFHRLLQILRAIRPRSRSPADRSIRGRASDRCRGSAVVDRGCTR